MTLDDSAIPTTSVSTRRFFTRRVVSAIAVIVGLTVTSTMLAVYCLSGPEIKLPTAPTTPTAKTDLNADLFAHWPADRKPEYVLFITAEMNGYIQKCGCSDPQKGGLERRWNLLEWLKTEKGFDVLPLDLGDITTPLRLNPDPHVPTHPDQVMLKYVTTMQTLKRMGYKAVGIGLEEFSLSLEKAISSYSLQEGNDYPRLLAANITGYQNPGQKNQLARAVIFPNAALTGSAILDWEVYPIKGSNVGVMGLVGDTIVRQVKGEPIIDAKDNPVLDDNKNPLIGLKIDPGMQFSKNSGTVVSDGVIAMSKLKNKPDLQVMLYQGPEDFARKLASGVQQNKKNFPKHFDVVVCRTSESEPPGRNNEARMEGNTLIVQVGHKGQQAGVVGVFKDKNGATELYYQRIALTEDYDTPVLKENTNVALQELQSYSNKVKQNGYLAQYKKVSHPLQVVNNKAKYVGSAACTGCHQGNINDVHGDENTIYAASKHANAYNALVNARKPSGRQFDGECIVCHTVGFKYTSGFVDAKTTPQLMNVGCESCHGPGSEHVAKPNVKALALELSPWKINGEGRLQAVQKMVDGVEPTPAEARILFRADQVCQQCHTPESDPHFRFEQFWPKIAHGNRQKPIIQPVPVKKEGERKDIPTQLPKDGPVLSPPKY